MRKGLWVLCHSRSKGQERKSKNTTALCFGIRQSKSSLLFPFSSVRVRLIGLMKGGFPEQLQLKACSPGRCGQPGSPEDPPVVLALQVSSSHPQLQLTSSPSGKFCKCWQCSLYFQLQISLIELLSDDGWTKDCLKLNCWKPQALRHLCH